MGVSGPRLDSSGQNRFGDLGIVASILMTGRIRSSASFEHEAQHEPRCMSCFDRWSVLEHACRVFVDRHSPGRQWLL